MFKKLKLLLIYIKTIRKHINGIRTHFVINSAHRPYTIKDVSLDNVFRIYTVLNFAPETQSNIRQYGYYYMDNEVKKFISELNAELKRVGLYELIGLTKADQIAPYSVLIIIEYKFLSTTKIARNLIISLILLLIGAAFLIF